MIACRFVFKLKNEFDVINFDNYFCPENFVDVLNHLDTILSSYYYQPSKVKAFINPIIGMIDHTFLLSNIQKVCLNDSMIEIALKNQPVINQGFSFFIGGIDVCFYFMPILMNKLTFDLGDGYNVNELLIRFITWLQPFSHLFFEKVYSEKYFKDVLNFLAQNS